MANTLILTGDVNLLNVSDPAVPFAQVRDIFAGADIVFGNLECCLYDPPGGHSFHNEGFYAAPGPAGAALRAAGFAAVGIANNVNYGEAAILASVAKLDALGIAHTGAGADAAAAGAPAIVARAGLRFGFLQRSAVYWPTNHEAGPETPGIADPARAYRLAGADAQDAAGRPAAQSPRPAADRAHLGGSRTCLRRLDRRRHPPACGSGRGGRVLPWASGKDVLEDMTEAAHAAIDAGADVVIGHGPHVALPVEVYRGKPIFYGLGSFSFHTGHGGRAHGDWVGMMARIGFDNGALATAEFCLVRHDAQNRTVPCRTAAEGEQIGNVMTASKAFATSLQPGDAWVTVALPR